MAGLTSFWGLVLGCSTPSEPQTPSVQVSAPEISAAPPALPALESPPEDEALLADIDAILEKVDGKRVPSDSDFCLARMPFGENRNSLCEHGSLHGSWTLWGPHPGSPRGVEIELSQYRFEPDQRQQALDRILAQVGSGAGHDNGGISWCHAQATWQEENFWGVDRACGVSHLVIWVQEVLALLRQQATEQAGAVGVVGFSGGWAQLVDQQGRNVTPPPSATQRIHMRVVEVADNDVLWARERKPQTGQDLPSKIGKLGPQARCIPLRMHPPGNWLLVTLPNGESGWASGRYLEEEPLGACGS